MINRSLVIQIKLLIELQYISEGIVNHYGDVHRYGLWIYIMLPDFELLYIQN